MQLALGQGSLSPSGAPGATMKTLTQIEPRVPISSAPYTISNSGSYYLTTNLTTTGHGIKITASSVSVDLMGFSLVGDRSSSFDYGIFIDGASNSPIFGISIRNGSVRNFGKGIEAEYVSTSRFKQLVISSNMYGVYFLANSGSCNGNTLSDCLISNNRSFEGVMFDADQGECSDNRIENCIISDNGGNNGQVNFYGYLGKCNGNMISRCIIRGSGSCGLIFYGQSDGSECNGNLISNCSISSNANHGIYLLGNGGRCNGNMITRCIVSKNGTSTSYCGIKMDGNSVSASEGNMITDCQINDNSGPGISMNYTKASRIEGNHLVGNDIGIYCNLSSNNFVFGNSMMASAYTNYLASADDTYGPVVTAAGFLVTTNGAASLSPWANFSR
jgi:parallel beta-helix repeat protein